MEKMKKKNRRKEEKRSLLEKTDKKRTKREPHMTSRKREGKADLLAQATHRKGAFFFAQAVLPLLLKANPAEPDTKPNEPSGPKYPPTLLFIGATASVKGSANFASLATGRFATRALSQCLAREFGPRGVHVAHVIIDGIVDVPAAKEWMKDVGPDAKIDPVAVSHYPQE